MASNEKQRIGLKSVFVRCAAIVALTTIVVTSALTVQSLSLIQRLAQQSVIDQATKAVESQAAALVQPIRFKALPKIEETILAAMTSAGPSGSDMIVMDASGAVLATASEEPSLRPDLVALAQTSIELGEMAQAEGGLWLSLPIRTAADAPVIGAVAMAWNADAALSAVNWESTKFLIVVAVVFATMMVIALWLFQRVLGRPLREMTTTISDIAAGDYNDKSNLNVRRDEFGIVGGHMRELTQRLRDGQAAEEERQQGAAQQAEVVDALSQHLTRLSKRDLASQISQSFPEQYEQLRLDFNTSVQNLGETIHQVVDATENMRGGASEISQASDDLARRTESQAATLEETAAALDELTASVKSAADGARNVGVSMERTRADAEKNREIVEDAVAAMAEIEQSSSQIGQIIGVIEDIAFQTNLLALNAGVEAARAGDAGRGFAVVASEVRALAQRSSEAAMEINGLIVDSSKHVERGVDLVGKAGHALENIVIQVTDVSKLVSGIADSSSEQATGLNEINSSMNQLDQVTQQNATMVEETTAAGHDLTSQAKQLSSLVSHFELDGKPPVRAEQPQDSKEPQEGAELAQDELWREEERTASVEPPKRALAVSGSDVSESTWSDF